MNVEILFNNNGYLKVNMPYERKAVDAVRGVPGRSWSQNENAWYLPDDDTSLQIFLSNLYATGMFTYTGAVKSHNPDLNDAESAIERMKKYLKLRDYSAETIQAYTSQVRQFFNRTNQKPSSVTPQDIVLYLEKMRDIAGISKSYYSQCVSSLKCFYQRGLPELQNNPAANIPLPKKDTRYPDILSRVEVKKIIFSLDNLKHRFLLLLVYSGGLRVSEAVCLRVSDLNLNRKMIHVRSGKGKKDRYVMLSEKAIELYGQYRKHVMVKDWLFPGAAYDSHLSIRSAQSVFTNTCRKLEIDKDVSIHSLRHAFATHLLEDGIDLRYIQELLGHKSSKTTELYTHVTRKDIQQIHSPADRW